MTCLNVEKMSCIIFWTNLFLSGRYKISCISQRVFRMFFEKLFFKFDKNHFIIRNTLFQWSAEFLASLPLNDDVMISFTRAFLSFGTWCGISCCKFFMWLDMSWSLWLTKISYWSRYMLSSWANGAVNKRAGICWIPYISSSSDAWKDSFVRDEFLIFCCWCSSIKAGKYK